MEFRWLEKTKYMSEPYKGKAYTEKVLQVRTVCAEIRNGYLTPNGQFGEWKTIPTVKE